MALTQGLGEPLKQYALAILRLAGCCPEHLSDPQNIDYLLQVLRDKHIIAALVASRSSIVKEFLATCTSLDTCAQNIREPSSLTHPTPQAQSSRTMFPERLAQVSQYSAAVQPMLAHA